MCLAIPGKVKSIEGTTGIVELGGVSRKTSLQLVPDASVGSYVLVHAGFAIQVIDEEEAKETLAIFDDYYASLENRSEEKR